MNENAVFSVNCNLSITYMSRLCATLLIVTPQYCFTVLLHCWKTSLFEGNVVFKPWNKKYATAWQHCFSFLVCLYIYSKCFLLKGNHFWVFIDYTIFHYILHCTVSCLRLSALTKLVPAQDIKSDTWWLIFNQHNPNGLVNHPLRSCFSGSSFRFGAVNTEAGWCRIESKSTGNEGPHYYYFWTALMKTY